MRQAPLFTDPALPEGLAYRDGVLSEREERELVRRLETLDFEPFQFHGYLGRRRVVAFGWRYDYAGHALRASPPIPDFLLPLRATVARLAELPEAGLQQVLVNEYASGAGIGWHRDRPMFEDIAAVSLLSACRLRFRRAEGRGWQRASLAVQPRSAYMLRGPARHVWQHSVPPVDSLRYSVTFRNFRPDAQP